MGPFQITSPHNLAKLLELLSLIRPNTTIIVIKGHSQSVECYILAPIF